MTELVEYVNHLVASYEQRRRDKGEEVESGAYSFPTLLQTHGQVFTPPKSAQHNSDLMKGYGIAKGAAKNCYANAHRAAMDVEAVYYAEGLGITDMGVPIEHAWLVTPEGQVIDPTWNETTGLGLGYFGVPVTRKWVARIPLLIGIDRLFAWKHVEHWKDIPADAIPNLTVGGSK